MTFIYGLFLNSFSFRFGRYWWQEIPVCILSNFTEEGFLLVAIWILSDGLCRFFYSTIYPIFNTPFNTCYWIYHKLYIVRKPAQTLNVIQWCVWSSQSTLGPRGNYCPSPHWGDIERRRVRSSGSGIGLEDDDCWIYAFHSRFCIRPAHTASSFADQWMRCM